MLAAMVSNCASSGTGHPTRLVCLALGGNSADTRSPNKVVHNNYYELYNHRTAPTDIAAPVREWISQLRRVHVRRSRASACLSAAAAVTPASADYQVGARPEVEVGEIASGRPAAALLR